jgi:hypothetical protein
MEKWSKCEGPLVFLPSSANRSEVTGWEAVGPRPHGACARVWGQEEQGGHRGRPLPDIPH